MDKFFIYYLKYYFVIHLLVLVWGLNFRFIFD